MSKSVAPGGLWSIIKTMLIQLAMAVHTRSTFTSHVKLCDKILRLFYPGQGGDGAHEDEEHGRDTEELEVVREIPGPCSAHLRLGPEVVNV